MFLSEEEMRHDAEEWKWGGVEWKWGMEEWKGNDNGGVEGKWQWRNGMEMRNGIMDMICPPPRFFCVDEFYFTLEGS